MAKIFIEIDTTNIGSIVEAYNFFLSIIPKTPTPEDPDYSDAPTLEDVV